MFSPEATSASAHSARNPRRRVRAATSDESLTAPARPSNKRRKRSSLAHDTFEPVSTTATNGSASGGPATNRAAGDAAAAAASHRSTANGSATNGHAKAPNGHHKEASPEAAWSDAGMVHRSRGSKRDERRNGGREPGLLQTETDHYSIWKDSDLPAPLQSILGKESWRADLVPGLGYAVALTHTQAVVWPYARDTDGSKALTIQLPFPNAPTRYSKDPLPLSALVHDAGVGELALLVILPTSGKLVYWESLTSAAKADTVRQRQQGLHGAVTGLSSSEHIHEIVEAEPDGFVLTTSYGRVVHLSVRDLQGRPHLSSTLLHRDDAGTGFWGSMRNYVGVGRKDTAAAHPAPMQTRSSRQCIIANANGMLETWELTRHGSKSLESAIQCQEALHAAISAVHPDREEHRKSLRIFDFTYSTRRAGDRKPPSQHRILLLCGYSGQESNYLVDAVLQKDSIDVEVVHPISRLPNSSAKEQDSRLRVLLPEPEHTAYVVGEEYIILFSVKQVEESPDAQLQLESHTMSKPFQDILMLNTRRNHRIVASAVRPRERGSDKATCYLLVDNFGLVRTTATPAVESETDAERRIYLCRSQIEQGVFFGGNADNLLDFSAGLQNGSWTDEEVEQTTLAINDSIVNNKSKRIPPMTPSMERQLQTRALWLKQLMLYVGKGRLSSPARWHLLWSAEKMAAAEAVWTSYSEFLRGKTLKEKLLLPELLDIMSQEYKNENNPDRGETDIVRHYLLNDVGGIELLVAYSEYAVGQLHEEGMITSPSQEAKLMHQAIELQTVILRTAFKFRTTNASFYGFPEQSIEDGIYQGGYSKLPYFWTSPEESPSRMTALIDQAFTFAATANEVSSPVEGEDVDLTILSLLVASVPGLIGLVCRVYEERCLWLEAQPEEADKEKAIGLRKEYSNNRRILIVKLLDIELDEDGFMLGERYRDVHALAELLSRSDEVNRNILNDPANPEEEQALAVTKLHKNQDRLDRYFHAYGDDWARATYGYVIWAGEASNLLTQPAKYREYVERFLAEHKRLEKLRWIHAVFTKNYDLGADTLMDCGRHEDSLWACKINLSMAKLCKLAAQEQKQTDAAGLKRTQQRADKRLGVAQLQEQLHAATRPVLSNAIDQLAEIDLAMDSYGSFVVDKPYLGGALKAHFEKLIQRRGLDAEELLEMLTLMAPGKGELDDDGFMRDRFFYALRLLRTTGFDGPRRELHAQIIWRRCLLQDDWAKFNRTEHMTDEKVAKATEGTAFFQTLVAGFTSGLLEKFPPLPPSDILGAGTSSEQLHASVQYRAASDDLVEALAGDLQREDTALDEAMENGRLELWWPGVVDGAKVAVRRQQDAEGEARAAEAEERARLEQEMDGEASVYDTTMDAEGDMMMEEA